MTKNKISLWLTASTLGILVLAVVVVFQGGLGFHSGYAGLFWMLLPIVLAPLFLFYSWRQLPLEMGISGQSLAKRVKTLVPQLLVAGLLSQVALVFYTLLIEAAKMPRIVLGVIIFGLTITLLALIAIFLRLSVPKWLGTILIVLTGLLSIVKGFLFLITGNAGGTVALVGRTFTQLLPPFAQVVYLGKDLLDGSPTLPSRFILPLLYLIFMLVLVLLKTRTGSTRLKAGAALFALGLLLLGANYSPRRVDPTTLNAFDQAVAITNRGIWPGYRMEQIRFAVRSGRGELFFMHDQQPTYGPATLEVLAFTATNESGLSTLHVLDFETTRALYDVFGSNSPEETMDSYVSVLTHEGFHGFQFQKMESTEGEENRLSMMNFQEIGQALNKDTDYNRLWKEELNALFRYLENETDLNVYLQARASRQSYEQSKLSEQDYWAYHQGQEVMEMLEGTARYIEMMSLPRDYQDSDFYKRLETGINGAERYYTSGMGRALILDRVQPDWKERFDFNQILVVE